MKDTSDEHTKLILTPRASKWPEKLNELRKPPDRLEVHGRRPPWRRVVGVVGTRASDPDAENFAYALGARLDRAGCTVLSGGARGIDTAAHMGSLSEWGRTVAVLATGLESPYPRENRELFAAIRRRGALLSEVAGKVPPHPGRFLRRNELVAALCDLLVVVQAPARSGALSTARCALRLGRPVLVVPYAPWNALGAGGLRLLGSGAEPCVGVEAVLSHPALQLERSNDRVDKGAEGSGLLGDARLVFDYLQARTGGVDELHAALPLSLPRIYASLHTLLRQGLVQRRGLGKFGRCLQQAHIGAMETAALEVKG